MTSSDSSSIPIPQSIEQHRNQIRGAFSRANEAWNEAQRREIQSLNWDAYQSRRNAGTLEPDTYYDVFDSPEDGTLMWMQPDYARREEINRITTNNGMWVVDRDGFIVAGGNTSTVNGRIMVLINNHPTSIVTTNGQAATAGIWAAPLPVRQGDVVEIRSLTGTWSYSVCHYIPPRLAPAPPMATTPHLWAPNVEVNLSDGTFGMRRTGNFGTVAANTMNTISWTVTGITSLIDSGGSWSYGTAATFIPINLFVTNNFALPTTTNMINSILDVTTTTGVVRLLTISQNARTTANTYDLWFRYRK
jgi:hypothetical protein